LGRSVNGTFQTPFIAFCMAIMAPIPPQRAPTIPTARATPEPGMAPLVSSWSPITGNWASVESSRSVRRLGLDSRTRPRTVVSTSSSGKIEKNE
jgi:hypothetical protein